MQNQIRPSHKQQVINNYLCRRYFNISMQIYKLFGINKKTIKKYFSIVINRPFLKTFNLLDAFPSSQYAHRDRYNSK